MRIQNQINETLEVSEEQWEELINLGAIDPNGMWQEPAYFDDATDAEEEAKFPCWFFLAIGLNQTPGEIIIEINMEMKCLH